jgi:hypothetical protein
MISPFDPISKRVNAFDTQGGSVMLMFSTAQ